MSRLLQSTRLYMDRLGVVHDTDGACPEPGVDCSLLQGMVHGLACPRCWPGGPPWSPEYRAHLRAAEVAS